MSQREILVIVNAAVKTGKWSVENGGKHPKLRHVSGRIVVFARSTSDYLACKNLARDIKHVEKGLPGWGMSTEIPLTMSLK